MIVPGFLLSVSILISVYMLCQNLCSYRVIQLNCSRRGAIWLNPFATVLFSVCVVPSLYNVLFRDVCCYVRKKVLLHCL